MMICSACNTELLSGDAFLECAVAECTKVYHYLCNNRQLTLQERASWVCPECYAAGKGIYCNEMPSSVNTPITNVSARNKSQPMPLSPEDLPFHIGFEMQQLRDQINILTEQLADAISTIGQFQFALSDCTKKVETCNQKLSELEQAPVCSRCHSVPPGISTQPGTINATDRQLYSEIVQTKPKISHLSPHRKDRQKSSVPMSTSSVSVEGDQPHSLLPPTNSNHFCKPAQKILNLDPPTIVPACTANENTAKDEWVEVRKRKSKQFYVCGTAGPGVTPLKAVDHRKFIHLWNMVSGAAEILSYLQGLCPGGNFTVEQLKPKGDYKSFKIGVPVEFFEKATAADTWPSNARVKEWFFRWQPARPQHTNSESTALQPANKSRISEC